MVLTIITFILVLGILIIFHELGHFIAAKRAGVLVEEFAFGFPPRIWSKKIGETRYVINAIPIGGYVKMLGELEKSEHKRAFENQSRFARFMISVAGVLANIILAWVILTIGFIAGMAPLVSSPDAIPGKKISTEIVVAEVVKDSPAEKAGVEQGGTISNATSPEGAVNFTSLNQFSKFTSTHRGETVTFDYKKGDVESKKEITLSKDQEASLGVLAIEHSIVKVPWYKAPYVALRETFKITELTFNFLKDFFIKLFSSGKVAEGVGGPVAIYVMTGAVVKIGFMAILQFIAILSVNLALINILPFPALDGGRILFIILETIARKKIIKEKVEQIIHTVGFALLILLIVLITYKDVVNLFK